MANTEATTPGAPEPATPPGRPTMREVWAQSPTLREVWAQKRAKDAVHRAERKVRIATDKAAQDDKYMKRMAKLDAKKAALLEKDAAHKPQGSPVAPVPDPGRAPLSPPETIL